jgi:hypothetical protein
MTLNREIFYRDPTTFVIPNDGVAQVGTPQSPEEWNVLRYELEAFVCEGEYREGLERILNTYLLSLDKNKQPAVWVSGFYGSGKSHFARVLEAIWRDIVFPDGAHARGLVQLGEPLHKQFANLTEASARRGGLWSAAGSLASTAGSVRLGLLSLVFQAARLPAAYPHARFVIWLQQQGVYAAVRAAVEASGADFTRQVANMYVSPVLAQALATAYPALKADAKDALKMIQLQFPQQNEIDDVQFLTVLDDVLHLQATTPGARPCTLIVLDELQQFIGDNSERTIQVQHIVERCSSHFGSSLLFVATGQAALEATPQLSKLQDRFTVRVMLEDKDVVRVVRDVVLRKAPAQVTAIDAVLEKVSGEIDRHLRDTKIGPTSGDRTTLIADYPLLPTRRRFWDRVLRAIDSAGASGQLRNQLRITHAAVRAVADQPLGHVIPADFIYQQQEQVMLQRKVLLQEMAAVIQELDDGTPDGALAARLCATIFLIGELPRTGVLVTGLRADADTLADLLVEELPASSANLRQRIPPLLAALSDAGKLMAVDGEYRLQTREGAAWEADFRARAARMSADESHVASERHTVLQHAVAKALQGVKLVQGESKTPRKVVLEFGAQPPAHATAVPVWVRDEWSIPARTLHAEAQQAGVDSPLIFVLLPRHDADALRAALVAYAAATETLASHPAPATDEAIVARRAMQTRQAVEKARLDATVAAILTRAQVYQGGGSQVFGDTLTEAVTTAVEASLIRLFPQFSMADHANWGTVVKRAGQGAPDALSAVGHPGEVGQHPVCREVRACIGAQRHGAEILANFRGAPYGWPDDAIAGALLTLMGADMVTARRNHQPVGVKELVQSQIGVTDFYGEDIVITASQRVKVRALLAELGFAVKPGEEAAALSKVLQHLIDLANEAGGAAPLPAPPEAGFVEALRDQSGNAQFVAMFEARDRLLEVAKAWRHARERKQERLPRWQMLERLLAHAGGTVAGAAAAPQAAAIRQQRSLLTEPDPLKPLLDELTTGLRNALQAARAQVAAERDHEVDALAGTAEWTRLSDETWRAILHRQGLGPIEPLHVANDAQLLASLDARPLAAWKDQALTVPARIQAAREEAAKMLEPKAVRIQPKSTTLHDAGEVEAYLAELRAAILAEIEKGRPVIL